MNITITIEGEAQEELVQRIWTAIGGTEARPAAAPATKPEAVPTPAPKSKTAPKAAEEPDPVVEPKPEKLAVDFETVRKAAVEAMNSGKRDAVRGILGAHGGKLADIPAAELPAVLAEIEAL